MENDPNEATEQPVWIASHLAYFFVPLPDLLGMPDSHVLEMHESTPLERVDREQLPLVNIGASLCFHHVEHPASRSEEQTVLFELAERSLPDPKTTCSSITELRESVKKLDSNSVQSRMATVVEMVIAMDGLDTEVPVNEKEAYVDNQLTEAFDRGISHIRQFQRAYYLSQRKPVRLVTRESLPNAIPFGVRRIFDDDGNALPFEVPLSLYLVNTNVPKTASPFWNETNSERLSTAIAQQSDEGPLVAVMDFIRESEIALERDGAYRSAVLFTATACEVLFDELLAHMTWEDGKRPEEAAKLFDGRSTTSARVKTLYHERLGGSWKLDADGPIGDWFTQVAGLRNRAIHGGYEPTLEEARKAVQATSALTEHLGNLVARRAKKYPRTALVIPGEDGLLRRKKWTNALNDLRHSSSEVHWNKTFARWRLAMNRARKDNPLAKVPSPSNADVYLVLRSDDSEQWVLNDPEAGLAAVIANVNDVVGLSAEQKESVKNLVESLLRQSDRTDLSILVSGASATSMPAGRWLPAYRLLPLSGVMVTGNDLDPV